MLEIIIPSSEQYDEITNQFYDVPGRTIVLEHSLASVAKWESKWHKPFLDKKHSKTHEELLDYIKCMTLTPHVDSLLYNVIPSSEMDRIDAYLENPMTATTFSRDNSPPSRRLITAEIIYYWMTALNIPFECEKWHLNRLLTLIKVCNIESAPEKKMSAREIASSNRAINEARRRTLKTKG